MFENIGGKLCALAKIVAVLGSITLVIGVLNLFWWFIDYEYFSMILGIALSASGGALLIMSWPIYAFGQITTDIADIRYAATKKS